MNKYPSRQQLPAGSSSHIDPPEWHNQQPPLQDGATKGPGPRAVVAPPAAHGLGAPLVPPQASSGAAAALRDQAHRDRDTPAPGASEICTSFCNELILV